MDIASIVTEKKRDEYKIISNIKRRNYNYLSITKKSKEHI